MHYYNNGLAWPAACSPATCRTFWLKCEFAGSITQENQVQGPRPCQVYSLWLPREGAEFPTVFLVCFHVTHPGVLYTMQMLVIGKQ